MIIDEHEMIDKIGSTAGNYYGRCAVWKDNKGQAYMGVENYTGWCGKEISQEFYEAFKKEWGEE